MNTNEYWTCILTFISNLKETYQQRNMKLFRRLVALASNGKNQKFSVI